MNGKHLLKHFLKHFSLCLGILFSVSLFSLKLTAQDFQEKFRPVTPQTQNWPNRADDYSPTPLPEPPPPGGEGDPEDNQDFDGDGIKDIFDNCPSFSNADQIDSDQDAQGNECDLKFAIFPEDMDGDGIADSEDNCENVANPDQVDQDEDTIGDACDANMKFLEPERFQGFSQPPTSCQLHPLSAKFASPHFWLAYLWICLIWRKYLLSRSS